MRLVLAALLVVALSGSAQAAITVTSVTVEPPFVVPDQEPARLVVTADIDCTSLLLRRPPGELGQVYLETEAAGANMVVYGSPRLTVNPNTCGTALTVPVQVEFSVIVTMAAPARAPQEGTFTLRLAAHPLDGLDPPSATGAFQAASQAALMPVGNPDSAGDALLATGQTAPFGVSVQNLGNLAFDAELEGDMLVVTKSGPRTEREPVPSAAIQVMPGASGRLGIDVPAPQGEWAYAQVSGRITYRAVGDATVAPIELPFSLLLTNSSVEEDAPAPAIAPLAVALLAALVVRRRRA